MARKNFCPCVLIAVVLTSLFGLPLTAQDNTSGTTTLREADGFAVSPPMRELAKLPRVPQYGFHQPPPAGRIPKHDSGVAVDRVERSAPPPAANYGIGMNFLGVGNGFPGFTVADFYPDTNMAVGDTQIVQWVNDSFAIFNKFNGTVLAGPIAGNLLFSALGGPCAAHYNDLEPIAQWDNAAHQWLLAQNVEVINGPHVASYACVAVSTTADATGTYYLYSFPLGSAILAYPKWGRWNNSWAQTMNNTNPAGFSFRGAEVCLYQRSSLLAGSPFPLQVCHLYSVNDDSLLPADIDSSTSPPAAEDQFFIGSVDAVDTSHLSLYSAHIDWLHPSQATFTGNNNSQLITVPSYTGSCSGSFGGNCVPQKGTTDELQSLGDRLMYRFAYDNDAVGGAQHWYVNHSVEATGGQIGVRWYEFQAPQISIPPAGLTLFQSGTWSPDSNYRWMGSIAADIDNDILAGYSVSSSSMYPSISIAGRLKSDPSGTLEPEVSVLAGTGSQLDTHSYWGQYSAMRLDPDGCTFWYTTEYYMVTASLEWSTQIASARFAGCQNPAYDGYVEICKQTDPDHQVSGPFSFTLTEPPFFSTGPISVPVGDCSAPTQVPSGILTISEAPQVGVAVENVTAYSYDQYGNYINELDSWTPPQQTATVTVVPGGVNLETVATFTNYAAPPGSLKICKIAGQGVTVGTVFTFTTTDGTTHRTDQVEAGPAPGYCVVDGPWPVNDPVTITENVPAGVTVSSITDSQGQSSLSPCQPAESNCTVATIGSGINEVTFTDVIEVPPGSCLPSESLSVMVLPSGNGCNPPSGGSGCVAAFVPEADWTIYGSTGVAVTNVEGSYIVGAPLIVTTAYQGQNDYINSCASDPMLTPPQTVCTASNEILQSNNVYVISGYNPPAVTNVLQTRGSGQVQFSGGWCTNCGVAMDATHSKAVIGLSLSSNNCGQSLDVPCPPGFQFLNLATDTVETPVWPSTAGQISEDPLVDPIRGLLLSASEGQYCNPMPVNGCHPNYEIGTITYPAGGNSQVTFSENQLDTLSTWPGGGEPDSSAEDCNAQIALASLEGLARAPSTPFIAGVTPSGTFTSPEFSPLMGSYLEGNTLFSGAEAGPIAVAQGGSHEGVLGQETFSTGGTITAFRLHFPYSSTAPFDDWVTCDLGDISPGVPFAQGIDPHTVTAYMSPNLDPVDGTHHSFAIFANSPPASYIAVVDLDRMLGSDVTRFPLQPHVCSNPPTMLYWAPSQSIGTLPAGTGPTDVVRFIPL